MVPASFLPHLLLLQQPCETLVRNPSYWRDVQNNSGRWMRKAVVTLRALFGQRFLFLPALLAMALPVFAELGGSEQSVGVDQARFRATRTMVTERGNYRFHEMSRADGMVIRHYVNPQGTVFGVSWSGPMIPDLSQLLGAHLSEFKSAQAESKSAQGKNVRQRSASVNTGELVVESSGHMRAFFGRAYLNSQLPAGVTAEIVQ